MDLDESKQYTIDPANNEMVEANSDLIGKPMWIRKSPSGPDEIFPGTKGWYDIWLVEKYPAGPSDLPNDYTGIVHTTEIVEVKA